MKYIDSEKLIAEINKRLMSVNLEELGNFGSHRVWAYNDVKNLVASLQQETQEESLTDSQQELVNVVTERMLKEGPIPTLKGKQKADFEKEFNRFKQIAGMINWPAYTEIYKKIILWFMAWGSDNLPNLGKPIDPDKMDIQQEQPGLPGISESGIPGKDFIPVEWVDACEKYGKWKIVKQEQPDNVIQWNGNNLKEVIAFTGKSPRFEEWFKSWKEFETYVHQHNDILKLFCEDGSHYEVPVGAWIVKTPDGYNVPSVSQFVHRQQEVDLEKEIDAYFNEHFSPCVDGTLMSEETGMELGASDYDKIARHFYELGLNARKER